MSKVWLANTVRRRLRCTRHLGSTGLITGDSTDMTSTVPLVGCGVRLRFIISSDVNTRIGLLVISRSAAAATAAAAAAAQMLSPTPLPPSPSPSTSSESPPNNLPGISSRLTGRCGSVSKKGFFNILAHQPKPAFVLVTTLLTILVFY